MTVAKIIITHPSVGVPALTTWSERPISARVLSFTCISWSQRIIVFRASKQNSSENDAANAVRVVIKSTAPNPVGLQISSIQEINSYSIRAPLRFFFYGEGPGVQPPCHQNGSVIRELPDRFRDRKSTRLNSSH